MASIKEVERTLPAHFTLSNKNLIITAHVGEEVAYFYEELGPTTTVVMLTKPDCYPEQKIFLDLMNDLGTTAISLGEEVDFDPEYRLSKKSQNVIGDLLKNYSYKKIIIHPAYPYENDPQNREIYEFMKQLLTVLPRHADKMYTYNKIGQYGKPKVPCGIKKGIIELYCSVSEPDKKPNADKLRGFISTASFIDGVRELQMD